MRDPKHGRDVPLGRDIAQLLRRFFAQIGLHAARQLIRGGRVDLRRWIEPMVGALLPYIARYFQGGVRRAHRDILRALAARKSAPGTLLFRKSIMAIVPRFHVKRGEPTPALMIGFDVLAPQVQTALLNHVYQFVQETLNTAAVDAEQAYEETRRQLMAGLEEGETQKEISRRIVGVFADPKRAFAISTYETSYAIHSGELEQAKASGLPMKKRWLTDAAACDKCLALEALGAIPLDQPYTTTASKNPRYAVVMHPGLHPHCGCSQTLEVQ